MSGPETNANERERQLHLTLRSPGLKGGGGDSKGMHHLVERPRHLHLILPV